MIPNARRITVKIDLPFLFIQRTSFHASMNVWRKAYAKKGLQDLRDANEEFSNEKQLLFFCLTRERSICCDIDTQIVGISLTEKTARNLIAILESSTMRRTLCLPAAGADARG
jgi:hypothetical protein